MNLGIDGKTALVTASSKGLGRACAIALAAEGVNVVICARGRDALESTAREITSAGGTAHAVVADVTDADAPDYLVETTVGRFGAIDIVVGNGGGPPAMRALEVDDAAMAQALNDNLRAMVRLVRAAVPRMVASRWGRICLITSSAVNEPMPALALSNTARTGLWAWAKTAAQDLRQHAGRVGNVVLGPAYGAQQVVCAGGKAVGAAQCRQRCHNAVVPPEAHAAIACGLGRGKEEAAAPGLAAEVGLRGLRDAR